MSFILPITNISSMQYAERMLHRSSGLPRVSSVSRIKPYIRDEKKKEREMGIKGSEYFQRVGNSAGLYVNELI